MIETFYLLFSESGISHAKYNMFLGTLHQKIGKGKGKGKSHIRSVRWEMPVGEDTCSGPSTL